MSKPWHKHPLTWGLGAVFGGLFVIGQFVKPPPEAKPKPITDEVAQYLANTRAKKCEDQPNHNVGKVTCYFEESDVPGGAGLKVFKKGKGAAMRTTLQVTSPTVSAEHIIGEKCDKTHCVGHTVKNKWLAGAKVSASVAPAGHLIQLSLEWP